MKYDEYDKFRSKFFNIAAKISDSKSIEYTISNEDKFYNFKHVAERLGNTAKQSMMVYILKHVDALCNDAKTGKTYSDETTYQRCLDVLLGRLAPTIIEQIRFHVIYVLRKFLELWSSFAFEIYLG